ncbi:hypothetical protein LN996_09845 [Arthrobacter sp. AK01]|uniref:hypothetical protein n=1 Tax=Arthrobacter sp. AK01 TaxID=2894084 RepID=UPI001E51AF83|nr:hypothetical protein [Arthrobacter sp. AK01]MCD4851111.1 hypothetical protein [Arthrobacter sp. AK01]
MKNKKKPTLWILAALLLGIICGLIGHWLLPDGPREAAVSTNVLGNAIATAVIGRHHDTASTSQTIPPAVPDSGLSPSPAAQIPVH